jgi:site-specific DNA-cytosine methylase
MKLIFAEILRELKASGYRVSPRLMNAMYFGVRHSRERMIFIGVREDIGASSEAAGCALRGGSGARSGAWRRNRVPGCVRVSVVAQPPAQTFTTGVG